MEGSDSDQNPMQASSSRLRAALLKARRSLNSSRREVSAELGTRFPFANQSIQSSSSGATRGSMLPSRRANKRKKLLPWKVMPCCVDGPACSRAPTRGSLDKLCKRGLGVLWFTRDDMLNVPTYLTAEELHFLIIFLYPLLRNEPYEFCKAAGPGNNVIVPLPIEDRRLKPTADHRFVPFCTPDQLKRLLVERGNFILDLCVK